MTNERILVPANGLVGQVTGDTHRIQEGQRRGSDRRRFSWKTFCFGFMHSRRRNLRRSMDSDALYLDWHHPWLFFLVVGTMLLSCVDAVMTLELLELGMVEANPVMAAAIGHSPATFAVSKVILTGTNLLVLTFFSKARFLNRWRSGIFLTVVFSSYACLVCYEFVTLVGRV